MTAHRSGSDSLESRRSDISSSRRRSACAERDRHHLLERVILDRSDHAYMPLATAPRRRRRPRRARASATDGLRLRAGGNGTGGAERMARSTTRRRHRSVRSRWRSSAPSAPPAAPPARSVIPMPATTRRRSASSAWQRAHDARCASNARALGRIERVDGVRRDGVFELLVCHHVRRHKAERLCLVPFAFLSVRPSNVIIAERRRVLTVPSGTPVRAAISECVKPS